MSIILKGIDMPKEGEHILALIKSDGKCSYFEETTFSRIMKTTEAIQIPKDHGRLIDADELKAKREWMRWRENNSTHEAEFVNSKYIDNAPTILAEE